MSYAALLSKVALFGGLPPEELEGLASLLLQRQYADGEIIFHVGDVGNALCIVRKGGVAIRLTSPGGKEVILSMLGRGDVFGELALIDGEPRSADAVAREETQLLLLPRNRAAMASPLVELVSLVARSLVDYPERVVVREIEGDRNPRIELQVAREDIGKVIGKDGRTAQSLRTIVSAASIKIGRRAHLDIID